MADFIMEQPNNNKRCKISIYTYFFIALFSLIVNFPMLYISGDFVGFIAAYLSKYINFMQIQPFVIFSMKVFAVPLVLNIFVLLTIEFAIVCIFHRKLNKLFKIEKLFTIKKFSVLAIGIISIQIIFSFLLWNI
jgi:hypothetical protein